MNRMEILNLALSEIINNQKDLKKPIYVIAWFWLGEFKGIEKIYTCDGDDDLEEIKKFFIENFAWTENTFGITEKTHELIRINLQSILYSEGNEVLRNAKN